MGLRALTVVTVNPPRCKEPFTIWTTTNLEVVMQLCDNFDRLAMEITEHDLIFAINVLGLTYPGIIAFTDADARRIAVQEPTFLKNIILN